jgi:hypothetical protein
MANTRSPNYPACSLSDAVTMLNAFWKSEERTMVPASVAAVAIGYKGLSGPARTALASLKKYGLLADDNHGMKVSALALRILNPADEYEKLQALREAAMRPDLFRQLSETHTNASENALKAHLINTLGFSDIGARTLIKSFRETLEFAKLPDLEYSPDQRENMEGTLMVGKGEVRSASGTKGLKCFSWPLSAETTARLEIVGNEELTAAHIEALSQYLEVAKKLLGHAKS